VLILGRPIAAKNAGWAKIRPKFRIAVRRIAIIIRRDQVSGSQIEQETTQLEA
jgi:hypothetical protein